MACQFCQRQAYARLTNEAFPASNGKDPNHGM